MFDMLMVVDPAADEAALVERIAVLERLKSAAAAGQARAAAALDAARRAAEAEVGVPAARRGRGVASEVALARRDSPARGGRHLGFAKALVYEMPHTLAALETGMLSKVAGHPDRARKRLSGPRGPARLGYRVVRRCRRPARLG